MKKHVSILIAMAAGAAWLALGTSPANATQLIRETWDGIAPPANLPIAQAYGDAYTLGFVTNVAWIANSNTPIMSVDNNSEVGTPGLPGEFVSAGDIWSQVYNGTGSLIDYHDPRSWAVRQLVPASQINFNSNGTYYFSIQLQHGPDGCLGIGFASGTNDAAAFVGAGITRASYSSGRFPTDLGNTLYITTGTLGQPGDPTDPTYGTYPVEGPQMVMAYATNSIGEIVPNTGFWDGLLVGKLTTEAGGSSTLSVWWATNGVAIPDDPSTVVWDATYSFNQTANMNYLLLWQTAGDYSTAINAFRVANTWGEVVGIESFVTVSPGNSIPQGQPVTFSSMAHNTPVTYQWLENGAPILNATNATYSIASPVPGNSGSYTLVVSNSFGLSTNNPSIQLTVTAAIPPRITQQPVSAGRYLGAPQTFTVGVFGSAPLSYQWTHNGSPVPPPAGTNASLVISSVGPGSAGTYYVTVSSPYPPAAVSSNATLTIITPPAGSFAAAVTSIGGASIWEFAESTNDSDLTPAGLPLHDFLGGQDGICPDTNNVVFGLAGPNLPGFAGLTSLQTHDNGNSSHVNLPPPPYTTNMTMMCWVYSGSYGPGIMLDTGGVGSNPGDGPMYGIDYRSGSLGSQWGSGGTMWGSGITLPVNQWVFVALVVQTSETTVYAGSFPAGLQSATRSSVTGTNLINISGTSVGPLAVGRTDYGWAQGGNSWAGMTAQFSDAAIFNQALSASAITNLFLTGVGLQVQGAPDGNGNLNLNWIPSLTLQSAPSVTGPFTDVLNATPPYTTPIIGNQQFFRARY
jgi:hypothetical protein